MSNFFMDGDPLSQKIGKEAAELKAKGAALLAEFDADPDAMVLRLLKAMPEGWGVGHGLQGWFVAEGADVPVEAQPDLVALFRALLCQRLERMNRLADLAVLFARVKEVAGDSELN